MGEKKKFTKVKECTHLVLANIIDIIYGMEIPDDLTQETGESLLVMGDLYLMENLKKNSLNSSCQALELGQRLAGVPAYWSSAATSSLPTRTLKLGDSR